MSIVDRIIKKYQNDNDFKDLVDDFFRCIKNNNIEKHRDIINAVKLAEYKFDLYNVGIHTK